MISIVLIEPENPGNIGAITRVMANFGFESLFLVNPKCDHLSQEAKNRAKHAQEVLNNAKTIKNLNKFDYLIATTAQIGTDYNLPRSPIKPEQLAKILPEKGNIALVFGREGIGLTNEEINKADFVVTIPTNKKYGAMNLSHSVAIVLYEISKKTKTAKLTDHITPVSKKDKEQIFKMLEETLQKMPFINDKKRETQRIIWKRMINKAFLSKREAFALMGFFRKLF